MQKLVFAGISGSGIVAVLLIAGVLLKGTGLDVGLGTTALGASIAIGTMLGLLGVIGVIKRVVS
jgi:uncharacterized membrane protein